MTNFKWILRTAGIAACVAAMLISAPQAQAQIAELEAQNIKLAIDRNDIAVSGISSGAAMAHQVHIAHSAELAGVGMVAGPPYRCADYFKGSTEFPVTSDVTAVGLCTAYYKKVGLPLDAMAKQPIEPSRLHELIDDAAKANKVDALKGVCGDHVFLIAGAIDDTVPAKVTDATADLYRWLLGKCGDDSYVKAHLTVEKRPGMPHTMPTDSSAEPAQCAAGSPYIADCDYPGASDILRFLHPKRTAGQPANRPPNPENLIKFSQRNVIGGFNPQGLMHENGYLYVPEKCRKGETCSLHIALHGCHQNEDQINEGTKDPSKRYLFPIDAGYNDVAERYGIVVLYPQASATGSTGGNPSGCWDWWGYASPGYYYQKDAIQIRNIWKIVDALAK
ncbi:MAG TPA: PHB depolymerase family esterase [Azospirillum sp.]|nr:PHB depolymerase family esterase [Azospirillum sp.]